MIPRDSAGENDVTVIFKSEAGGRRWQHLTGIHAEQQGVERNYTLILGSHRNTCIRVEKDGQLCDRVTSPFSVAKSDPLILSLARFICSVVAQLFRWHSDFGLLTSMTTW